MNLPYKYGDFADFCVLVQIVAIPSIIVEIFIFYFLSGCPMQNLVERVQILKYMECKGFHQMSWLLITVKKVTCLMASVMSIKLF